MTAWGATDLTTSEEEREVKEDDLDTGFPKQMPPFSVWTKEILFEAASRSAP